MNDRDRPALETLGRIFDERANVVRISERGGVTITCSGDPEDLIADFQPRNIHGELADSTRVSVVEAQGHKQASSGLFDHEYRQVFQAQHVVMNEHINGGVQEYPAFKFRVRGPRWWRSRDGEAATDDGSRLIMTTEGDDRWFEFFPINAMTLRDLDRWVLSPITTLSALVTGNPAAQAGLRVRTTADSPWRMVYQEQDPVGSGHHELLDASHLTAERFASWIDLRKRTDALDAAAIDKLDGVAIQTEVLTLAAVAEGLHWRLFDGKKRVPALSDSDLKQARRAARRAALDRLSELDRSPRPPLADHDRVEFEKAMNDAFSFINEPTFRSRMSDLVIDAQLAIPNIVAAFADWPSAVKGARNTLAHRGTEPHSESVDQFYDLLIALSYSIPWVLRTVLLNRAGFNPPTLQEAYGLSSAYNHHVTNTRHLLAGGPYAAEAG
ncbi:hypothetical protein A5712_29790 [Mycobacterium sp. E2327]|nr:hypothetical protein A5712_29790 [Mycobacterium sp. E2327]